jgi:hypothetical protein
MILAEVKILHNQNLQLSGEKPDDPEEKSYIPLYR